MNESQLESKFSNIYIMLLYSITSEDMSRVKHFLSDEIYNKYDNIVKQHIEHNEVQCYDELNVAKIRILNRNIVDEKEICEVEITSRYMDYIMDKDTGNIKKGHDNFRIEKKNILIFEKKSSNDVYGGVYTCKNCGSSVDINFSGVCSYCNQSIDLESMDYILTSIETY